MCRRAAVRRCVLLWVCTSAPRNTTLQTHTQTYNKRQQHTATKHTTNGTTAHTYIQFVRAAWNKLAGRGGLTLWTNPASRGQIVAWYLREIDASDLVNPVNLDMKEKREHKAPAFLAVNPFGKVPALSDGGFHLFESGALMLYAADRFPLRSGIRTPQQRAAAAQWVLFA